MNGRYAAGGEGTADAVVASFLETFGGKVVVAVVEGDQGEVSGLAVRFIVLQCLGLTIV